MELQDTTLRVLYDFEYSTKDGKFVRIQEGEKLFLIKKTNKDWWQVIRSSGKPFYVPATYVEVYKKLSNDNKKNIKNIIPTIEKTRSYSEGNDKSGFVSVKEIANSIDSNSSIKQKPKVAKRTIFPVIPSYENIPAESEVSKEHVSVIEAYQNLTFPTRVITIQDVSFQKCEKKEKEEEEADYVNLRPEGDGFTMDNDMTNSVDSITDSSVGQHNTSSISLSLSSSSIPPPSNNSIGKLSTCSSKLSLDNLIMHTSDLDKTEGILKTLSLSSTSLDGICKVFTKPNTNIIKSMSSDDIKHYISSNNNKHNNQLILNVTLAPSSLPHYNTVPVLPTECTQTKLTYNGSFKTKYEREMWTKKSYLKKPLSDTNENNPDETITKKSLETVKESLNEISHTTYNFLDEDDAIETQDGQLDKGIDIKDLAENAESQQDFPKNERHLPNFAKTDSKNIEPEQGSNVRNIRAKLESKMSAIDNGICKKLEPFKVSLIDVSEGPANSEGIGIIDPAASESELSGDNILSASEKGSMNSLLDYDSGKHIQSTDDGDMSSDEKRKSKIIKDKDNKKRGIGLIRNRRVS